MLQGSLGAVSPTEEFECSCGIDPSIKIKYHPVKKMHNASKGWMSKSEQSDFDQRITVTNTRQRLITIRVTDHLPESSDNAIKVRVAVTYFTQNYDTSYLLQRTPVCAARVTSLLVFTGDADRAESSEAVREARP